LTVLYRTPFVVTGTIGHIAAVGSLEGAIPCGRDGKDFDAE
jgi:hypothetical protein